MTIRRLLVLKSLIAWIISYLIKVFINVSLCMDASPCRMLNIGFYVKHWNKWTLVGIVWDLVWLYTWFGCCLINSYTNCVFLAKLKSWHDFKLWMHECLYIHQYNKGLWPRLFFIFCPDSRTEAYWGEAKRDGFWPRVWTEVVKHFSASGHAWTEVCSTLSSEMGLQQIHGTQLILVQQNP